MDNEIAQSNNEKLKQLYKLDASKRGQFIKENPNIFSGYFYAFYNMTFPPNVFSVTLVMPLTGSSSVSNLNTPIPWVTSFKFPVRNSSTVLMGVCNTVSGTSSQFYPNASTTGKALITTWDGTSMTVRGYNGITPSTIQASGPISTEGIITLAEISQGNIYVGITDPNTPSWTNTLGNFTFDIGPPSTNPRAPFYGLIGNGTSTPTVILQIVPTPSWIIQKLADL